MKDIIRKFIPKSFLRIYHKALATMAALFYGFPSKRLKIIGVTGTTGKTTVCNMIARILEEGGYRVAMSTTANFRMAGREWTNTYKQTMLGRFKLQKFLKRALRAGCQYTIIETSSEGLAQGRHLFIDYDTAIFTNLSPEHIESHGNFKKYKEAKAKMFKTLAESRKETTIIANLDDECGEYFLGFKADKKYGYAMNKKAENKNFRNVFVDRIQILPTGSNFFIDGQEFNLKLLGRFNISNALAAICVGLAENISIDKIKSALEKFTNMPGRMERINVGQNFNVFVDYAHEPKGLESVYQTLKEIKKPQAKILAVLGSCGGGRDKWRRPILGKLAANYVDYIFVTNEDPYDEDPKEIIKQVASGALEAGKQENKSLWKIFDRREAIKKALYMAQEEDFVILTGKGSEQCIMSKNGKRIPWDDRKVAREILKELIQRKG